MIAAHSRLKGRVLLETLEGRVQRLALPATEQMAQADLVTSFQQGRVAVSAVPGGPVPAGAQAPPDDRAAKPASGGAVVTSVPPVGASRLTPPPMASPQFTRANEPIPPDFPVQSPAGPAPPRRVQPDAAGGEDAPAPVPTPMPRPVGPGVG